MKQTITFFVVAALIAGGTAAHGFVTGRWAAQAAKMDLVLPEIPIVVGDWKGEDMKSGLADDKHLRNLTRKYTHPKSGRSMTVSLTLGPAGLAAQHTPEYCYPGSGYQSGGATQSFSANDAQFRSAVFRKAGLGGTDGLRIFWAWSADGRWTAPAYPELSFVRGSVYKLYVVSGDAEKPPADDAELLDFLNQLLTTLRTTLFADPA